MLKSFSKLSKGLAKTKSGLIDRITSVVSGKKVDEDVLEELEELLIASDVGVDTAERIIDDLRGQAGKTKTIEAEDVIELLKEELIDVLDENGSSSSHVREKPYVISIVGINGVGKTTTIGKLAHHFRSEGRKVMLAAADTFRAAAIDQLNIWADRAKADIIHTQMGADPGAVAFDALKAAQARNIDVLIVDTAGRLHTRTNLMAELAKIHRVMQKQIPEAPHDIFLIIDATTGQNGLAQAKKFADSVNVTGIILTKLDGTAKGGIVFTITRELGIPVRFVGVGERLDDLAGFDPKTFVEALFQ